MAAAPSDFDAIVIGAGVIGSATAMCIAKAGKKVLLVEQFDFLHRRGSSHGESRIIRYTYPEAHYTNLMPECYRMWSELEEFTGMRVFTKTGGVDLGRKEDLAQLIDTCEKHRIAYKILTPAQLMEQFQMKVPADYVGVYQADTGILNATKTVAALQLAARKLGATLRDNSPVKSIQNTATGVAVTIASGETFTAKRVVLTPGAWFMPFLNGLKLGLPLKVQVLKKSVYYFNAKPGHEDAVNVGRMPVFIDYTGSAYGFPGREFPGVVKVADHFIRDPILHTTATTRTFEPSTLELQRTVLPFVRNVLTNVEPRPVMAESCLYTDTPDHDFILDVHPLNARIVIGAGFSGHGFKLATVVGKILSQLAIDGTSTYDLSFFKVSRPALQIQSKL